MIVVLSSLSLVVARSENLFLVLCVVGYNEFTLFGSRFCLYLLSHIGTVAPNRHPLHCIFCWYCFQVSCGPSPISLS